MKKLSRLFGSYYKKLSMVGLAALLGLAGVLPALIFGSSNVSAASQVQSRSITMSSSVQSATSQTYTVKFTPATTESNPDVVIQFCSNDPLIGDSCTATAGSDVPDLTSAAASGWTVTPITSNTGIELTTSTVSFTGGTPVTITLTGVKNPSALGSFYGRIIDYPNGGYSTNYVSPTSLGTYIDYGGVAMSTAESITVQAKVFETISFCVYSGSCGTPAVLDLGNATTGALSTGTAYVNSGASYSLATNAYHGVAVTMTGQTLCNQATLNFTNCPTGASANTISAMGATAIASVTGSSQFGMCAYNGANASLLINTAYDDTVNNCNGITTGSYSGSSLFGFDDTNTSGTNSAGGSTVMHSLGALNTTTGNFTFLGNISATTTAGIYNSDLNLVATGTF